ncbi:hypothetical protein OH76DRAFT_1483740 [Lentinus brumalis]|uniref:Uncharacterized protein n=1 Tax=Lentinus brumalis TaxID=2498619 RepID=A0A371D807_9APHY|nr:hypothetical protein OH76DRAFT_1483740 [Polyporus brumalis]
MAPAAAALSASEVEVPIASPVSVDVCSSLDARRRTPHAHIDRQYIVWTDRDRKRVTIPVVELPAARCTSPAAHITDGEIPDPLAFAFAIVKALQARQAREFEGPWGAPLLSVGERGGVARLGRTPAEYWDWGLGTGGLERTALA